LSGSIVDGGKGGGVTEGKGGTVGRIEVDVGGGEEGTGPEVAVAAGVGVEPGGTGVWVAGGGPLPLTGVLLWPALGVRVGVGEGPGDAVDPSAGFSNPIAETVAATAVSTSPGSADSPMARAFSVERAAIVPSKSTDGVGVPALASTALSVPVGPPVSAQAVSESATSASVASA
jgi:hypothetical protein